ncbi:leucine-rich repeat domain-containing protein [Clostridium chauvoei]|uniref:Leucine-rich repeat domain-containing protein n=2 Tax=Clostridium chauvoei TaxID=46867 RepID=A0ABD4RFV1_9CLOT|nr:leucine-rich repeat domain-containing protein [Clostridium chauvoei]ATD54271.1 hypothetical protein BTM20_03075 [Clostridium chauvoei]ATD58047.1 hypothetical protein BTM21_09995 [Clostridium chauvoei]MBX7279878.1 leucine-rich repeat domain-containing protein [Clostridium chauvoei]MBX7282204.1 leucine-rich repeat domain-containing protein [Clostridium chauvoei]MBX7284768.1 leucine-rich repeat domain-containing protein [Clostridium chauvoei]
MKKRLTAVIMTAILGTSLLQPTVKVFAEELRLQELNVREGYVDVPDVSLKKAMNKAIGQKENDDIPKWKLEKLTELYAMFTDISNLEGIQYCTNLKELNLQDNKISDINLLKNLKKLRTLFLNVNQIEDISALSELSNLRELYLGGNKISNIYPLRNLKRLQDLSLGNLLVKDIKPLEELDSLKYLDLYENKIDNLEVIRNIKGLLSIDLSENGLKDINVLKGLKNLEWIRVSYNEIEDLTPIEDIKDLKGLDIGNNKIKDISVLNKFSTLELLHMSNNNVADISALADLYELKRVKLDNQQITLENKEVNGRLILENPVKSINGYEEAKNLSNDGQAIKANKYLTWNSIKNNNINNLSFNFKEELNINGEQVTFSGKVVQPVEFNANALRVEDINKDKSIDINDLANLGIHYNKKDIDENWNEDCDLNKDGIIDIFDLVIVSKSI